jgi:hypothetical protein
MAADARAIRAALGSLDGGASEEPDVRAVVRSLLSGEVAPPTADVAGLVRRGTDAEAFYLAEIRPSWEGLSELERARRLDGFVELAAMLEASPEAMPDDMAPLVRTKTLVLAWAFDETYGYLSRLARGRHEAPDRAPLVDAE